METTIDRLLGGKIEVEQPARGFRTSIDAILLAAAVPTDGLEKPDAAVLDAGCGVAAAALALHERFPTLRIHGLEIDRALVVLARSNVRRNGAERAVAIVEGDLLHPTGDVAARAFSTVLTNPPFNPPTGQPPAERRREVAMHDHVGIEAWLSACLKRVAPRGKLVVIHRADRLPAILAAVDEKVGDIEIIPLFGKADGRPAKRVIVRCRKGSRGAAILSPGLVLHESDGSFTAAANALLRDGRSLDEVLGQAAATASRT